MCRRAKRSVHPLAEVQGVEAGGDVPAWLAGLEVFGEGGEVGGGVCVEGVSGELAGGVDHPDRPIGDVVATAPEPHTFGGDLAMRAVVFEGEHPQRGRIDFRAPVSDANGESPPSRSMSCSVVGVPPVHPPEQFVREHLERQRRSVGIDAGIIDPGRRVGEPRHLRDHIRSIAPLTVSTVPFSQNVRSVTLRVSAVNRT